jgi:O-antigen/teichoic acid export membrane protein
MRFNMLLIVIGSMPFIILSPWLIPFLFGNEFQDAVLPAMILFLVYIPLTMRQLIMQCLHSLNQPQPTAINSTILTCIFGVVAFPMSKEFGLTGIIFSLLIANSFGFYFFLNYLHKNLNLTIKDWWGLNWKTYIQVLNVSRGFILQSSNK